MADAAASNILKLLVLTPTKRVAEATAENIYFPTSQGIVGILPAHAALVCQVGTGVLHYTKDNVTSFMTVSGGVAEVKDNVVTLLVDRAEEASTIDIKRADKSLERAQQRLSGMGKGGSAVDMDRAIAAEARARARLEAASSFKHRKS